MLLSSVSLVAKPKNGKNKDVGDKKIYRQSNSDVQYGSEVTCEQCQKEIQEENSVFKFPSAVRNSQNKDQNANNYQGDRVTIATGDAHCLSVEKFYYTIVLREETKCDMTCVFRKKVLETKTVPNGRVETVVFALDCDQDFYLTASSQRDLELNYHTSVPRAAEPDERIFDIFFTNLGHSLIQPKLCNNTYLHHLDQALSLQQLDLNWRCPEEYFFHFNAVPEYRERKTEYKVCTHLKDINESASESSPLSDQCSRTAIVCDVSTSHLEQLKMKSDNLIIELPTRRQKKSKNAFSALFLGCFSARSHSISAA